MDSLGKTPQRKARAAPAVRPAIAAVLLEARAQRYARALVEPLAIDRTVVTFARAQSAYAIALHELSEIRPLSRVCVLPGTSFAVPGVVHYRGELLSLLDLGALSGQRTDASSAPWLLVVEHGGERLGLLADDVMDVVEVPAGSTRPLPVTLGEEVETFVGISADGVLITDAARLMATQMRWRRLG